MTVGICLKCGQGGPELPELKPSPVARLSRDRYCPKCGDPLYSRCTACNGTGIKPGSPPVLKKEYCDECHRELKPPDDTCYSCGGTGEIPEKHYYCRER